MLHRSSRLLEVVGNATVPGKLLSAMQDWLQGGIIMQVSRRVISCGLVVAALCAGLSSVWAQEDRITIEAVDRYSCGALSNNIANVDNFRAQMLSVPGYAAGVRSTDGNVWPADFIDPELEPGGNDTAKFDRPGDGISYFSGHGTCDDQTDIVCTSAASCPDINTFEKRCLRYTDNPLQGRCVYSRPRNIVVDQTGTSCQLINYSTNGVRWGEDPSAGSWGGAGTNGGINLAVIDNSCGITPGLYMPELLNAFAGVSTIALIMPTRVSDDTADVANRGRAFADRYVANVNSAVAPSWAGAINSVTGGSSCAFGGGGHGIVGCGAHIAISVGIDQAHADWANRTETWVQLRDPANDATGANHVSWIYTCNYDCNNHPFILP